MKSPTPVLDGPSIPRFTRQTTFRFDEVRQQWIILGPERVFYPNEIAVDVLQRIDGHRTLDDIVADLSEEFDAPHEVIFADVKSLIMDFIVRGVLAV